jgi:hypothetical protein
MSHRLDGQPVGVDRLRPWLMLTGGVIVGSVVSTLLSASLFGGRPAKESTDGPPASCIQALAAADRGFSLAAEGVRAVAAHSAVDVTDITAQLDALQPRYTNSRLACRESR